MQCNSISIHRAIHGLAGCAGEWQGTVRCPCHHPSGARAGPACVGTQWIAVRDPSKAHRGRAPSALGRSTRPSAMVWVLSASRAGLILAGPRRPRPGHRGRGGRADAGTRDPRARGARTAQRRGGTADKPDHGPDVLRSGVSRQRRNYAIAANEVIEHWR